MILFLFYSLAFHFPFSGSSAISRLCRSCTLLCHSIMHTIPLPMFMYTMYIVPLPPCSRWCLFPWECDEQFHFSISIEHWSVACRLESVAWIGRRREREMMSFGIPYWFALVCIVCIPSLVIVVVAVAATAVATASCLQHKSASRFQRVDGEYLHFPVVFTKSVNECIARPFNRTCFSTEY